MTISLGICIYAHIHILHMPKSVIADAAERMRLYEIFVAAGLTNAHKNIASVAALGGIGDDEPVIKTYRTVNLQFDSTSQSFRRAADVVSGGREVDKKTLVIQL